MDNPNYDNVDGYNDDITKANDTGTYNVEAADTDIDDDDSNAADDDDADNADAITNAKDGVIYDVENDTDAKHDPLCCLVWSSIALINWARCARIIWNPWQGWIL